MPRLSDRVLATERQVNAAAEKGEYRIRGARNLVLRVTVAGTKNWSFAYLSPAMDRWRKMSLGSWPTVSLGAAKDRTVLLAADVRQGKDPLAERARPDTTFRELADRYMAEARHRLRPAWAKELERILKVDVFPVMNGQRIDAITKADVVKAVERVADRGCYVAADRVLGIIRAIFNWANATGRLDANPTMGLKKRNTSRPRGRVLTDEEIRLFWGLLDSSKISLEIRDALRLQLVLAARVGEVVGAAKSEIDLDVAVWTIPATRVKSRREHKLPLPPMAVGILRDAMSRCEASSWLFRSPVGGPMRPRSAMHALLRLRARTKGLDDIGTHDLRRTAATRLGELGVADEIVSRILNHAPTNLTRRVYNKSERFDEMKAALEAWAVELGELVGTSEHHAEDALAVHEEPEQFVTALQSLGS